MPLPRANIQWGGTLIDYWSEYGPPNRRELEIHVTITGPPPTALVIRFVNRQNGNVAWTVTADELVEGLNNIILTNQQATQPQNWPYYLTFEVVD